MTFLVKKINQNLKNGDKMEAINSLITMAERKYPPTLLNQKIAEIAEIGGGSEKSLFIEKIVKTHANLISKLVTEIRGERG
jgi:hypothetical protein